MEFRLLGPVQVLTGGRQVVLGPRKERLLLGVLALEVNHLVSADRLVDLTWPSHPPPTAHHAVHVRVSRLRQALARADSDAGEVEIVTHGSSYLLHADPMCVDAHHFRALISDARSSVDDRVKVSLFRKALGLWHGPALADVATAETADQLCGSLEEARLGALEECLAAQLRLGQLGAVIEELTGLFARYPYRQQLLAQLMIALYRAGRSPDALRTYRRARARLADELGLDPSPALQQLEAAILAASPTLELAFGQ